MAQNEDGRPAGSAGEDPDRFIVLYRAEYPGMVRLARALTGEIDRAEDVVQDAFTRLHGRIGALESPGGYLRTTVVNLCRDQGRRRRREYRTSRLAAGPTSLPLDALPLDALPLDALPLDAMELIDVLLSLSYRQRAVLVLRYWGDWSEAEIAEALGCRPGTVKALASRGIDRLRKEIGP